MHFGNIETETVFAVTLPSLCCFSHAELFAHLLEVVDHGGSPCCVQVQQPPEGHICLALVSRLQETATRRCNRALR